MKIIGLIGKSLGHSFSKKYFEDKFKVEAIVDFKYLNFEIEAIEKLQEVIQEYRPIGFNVTIPYKEEIIPYLDSISSEAESIGAVNTVLVEYLSESNYKLKGYNTDAFGFHQSIKPFFATQHEKALILGTGGASKAVAHVLQGIGVDVFFASREPKKANEFGYEQINENAISFFKMIVNTTPVGTYPNINESLNLPLSTLSKEHLVVDLIYNPEKTKLLQTASDHGSMIVNGLPMLKQQAEKAWKLFKAKK